MRFPPCLSQKIHKSRSESRAAICSNSAATPHSDQQQRAAGPLLLGGLLGLGLLAGCAGSPSGQNSGQGTGIEIKLLVGSAMDDFCQQAAAQFNQKQPKLATGQAFFVSCQAQGSGDVVDTLVNLAGQVKAGTLTKDAPQLPTLVSVDGEIYHSQLIARMDQLFPGQNYIPGITDAPLLANSPMVFMARADLAKGLSQVDDLFKRLVTAKTHRDLDPSSPALPIHYVQTAPTRSNSGLQTLVAQFASVSGQRPEQLTVADISRFAPQVQKIQSLVTRYGISTASLANAMVKNGPFWASIGSVYESSVIAANSGLAAGQPRYQAVYPQSTFSSNMRAILPQAPWVSAEEKAAAEQVIEYLRSPAAQAIATQIGLRPGVPGVALGPKFTPEFGVDPQAKYDSYRPPQPQVVTAMLKSWEDFAKKPSQVVIVVDTSGSMAGAKLANVQTTLEAYLNSLGPKDQVALMRFSSDVGTPVLVDSSPAGRDRGLQFITGLDARGNTHLYDATLAARNWLRQNLRENAINAVLVLTDGEDTGSRIELNQLGAELQKSGFNSDQRIAFFTVGYGQEGEFDPQALKQIADLNGGYYSKGDPATIGKLMANLQLEF
jgi:Ca-activated chloride channel homolog